MSTKHILINGDCRKMSQIQNESVHLIVTSPPYWQLKDYGTKNQIGFNDTYEAYINNLNLVWKECHRILMPGCRLCVNMGDQFARSVYYGRYKVVSIHSEIIRFCESIGFDYMGSIIWQKPTSMHTTGGEKVMGSYPYPRGGIIKIDFEHILLFRKLGKAPMPSREAKEASALTMKEWNEYFSSHWTFSGAKQNRHIAVFPEELPKRLIKMFSFVGDMVCDPFMGSGTTALAAGNLGRNSVGYELNNDFRVFYKEKVIDGCLDNADGLVVHTVDQKLASLLHGDDAGGVDLPPVNIVHLQVEKRGRVVLDGGVDPVHHFVACRQHLVDEDATLHLLGLRVQVENAENQRYGGQPDQNEQRDDNAFFHCLGNSDQ